MGRRIGQGPDDLQEFDHRAGPAVGGDERQRVGMGRAHVDEVDSEAVDLGPELGQAVQPCLGGPPVIPIGPIATEILEVRAWHPLGPVLDGLGIGPARPSQPSTEIGELRIGYPDVKLGDLVRHPSGTVHRDRS